MPVYHKAEVGGCGIKYTWTIAYLTAVLVIQRRMLHVQSGTKSNSTSEIP